LLAIEKRAAIRQCEELRKLLSTCFGESSAGFPGAVSRSAQAEQSSVASSSAQQQQQRYVRHGLTSLPVQCNLPLIILTCLSLSCLLVQVCALRCQCQVPVPRRMVHRERTEQIEVMEPVIPHRKSIRCLSLIL
jgi:hypothetical protein